MTLPIDKRQQLSPCPFCGSQPLSMWQGDSDETGEQYGYWTVECRAKECGNAGDRFCGVHGADQASAEQRWNERFASSATTPPTAEELRLQNLLDSYGQALLRIKQRRCTNPKAVGDSACECCTHHWHAIEDEERKHEKLHQYVGVKD